MRSGSRSRGSRPVASRYAPRSIALVACVFAVMISGCLFPPVITSGDGAISRDVGPGLDIPVYDQRVFQESERGTVSAGASVTTDVEQGTQPHVFDLPPNVITLRIELEWDHDVYDLDLAAELRRAVGNGSEVVWSDENRDGAVGEPDTLGAWLEVTDPASIRHDETTRLRVTVHAKAGVDVPYTLGVRAVHLVPLE